MDVGSECGIYLVPKTIDGRVMSGQSPDLKEGGPRIRTSAIGDQVMQIRPESTFRIIGKTILLVCTNILERTYVLGGIENANP